jgi:hypothetical protein
MCAVSVRFAKGGLLLFYSVRQGHTTTMEILEQLVRLVTQVRTAVVELPES